MAGHSKWANIKHKKNATDKKKGRIFSRIAKEIMVAAKEGGGDADANPRLRTALAAAKNVNMPKDNIERAVKKGCGELDGVNFEQTIYEGYGPEGVAIMVDCLTDNRNRTASEVRMVFDRANGNLAGCGAVAWMFNRKAHFVITGDNADEDILMDIVLEAGADDIAVEDGVAEIWGEPEAFEAIAEALSAAGIETDEGAIIRHPDNTVEIKDVDTANKVIRMIDKFEDLDDVQAVHANFDIAEDIADQVDA